MTTTQWPVQAARNIVKRIVVCGSLTLITPAHLGNGESSDVSDMPLMTASEDGQTPLLTGASLAGGLRAYLRSRERGYYQSYDPQHERDSLAVKLFGGLRMDDQGEQSPLIVEDAYGLGKATEMRAGVRLAPDSRTAADNLLYNAQYWQAGIIFPLRFELVIRAEDDETSLLRALAAALQGLEREEIAIGARKQRGFGQCKVSDWRVLVYDLSTPAGLLAWLTDDSAPAQQGSQIAALLKVDEASLPDRRSRFELHASFALEGSLLIRSSSGELKGPDMVHLHSQRPGSADPRPVLSGTSLAGAMRARALRIANTLGPKKAREFVNQLFGPELIKGSATQPSASRVRINESVIENTPAFQDEPVQSRVTLDRFTGGSYPTALFSEQPTFARSDTRLAVAISLQQPTPAQTGMMLLLLKDLWTSDLPLGGESGVGRGRLRGISAKLCYQQPDRPAQQWSFTQGQANELAFQDGKPEDLEGFVQELLKELQA